MFWIEPIENVLQSLIDLVYYSWLSSELLPLFSGQYLEGWIGLVTREEPKTLVKVAAWDQIQE